MTYQVDTASVIQQVDSVDVVNVLDKFESLVLSANSMIYSFWLSCGALILIYLLKKLYIKEVHTAFEVIPALQEFFIDLCMTTIPLIAISCNEAGKSEFGYLLVFLSVIVISICAYLRKISSKCLNSKNYCGSAVSGIFCVVICIVVIVVLYYYISR